MVLYTFIISGLLLMTEAVDRKKLISLPKPAAHFDLASWSSGKWYTQARYVPCSFSGSRGFSDIEVVGELDGGLVKQTISWRAGVCTKVTMLLKVPKSCDGNFVQKDPIGGVMTGQQVVVAYNPKKGYEITWGCTKESVLGNCDDPWLAVKTRARFPGRYVFECIISELQNLYALSLTEMDIVSHKQPCSVRRHY